MYYDIFCVSSICLVAVLLFVSFRRPISMPNWRARNPHSGGKFWRKASKQQLLVNTQRSIHWSMAPLAENQLPNQWAPKAQSPSTAPWLSAYFADLTRVYRSFFVKRATGDQRSLLSAKHTILFFVPPRERRARTSVSLALWERKF